MYFRGSFCLPYSKPFRHWFLRAAGCKRWKSAKNFLVHGREGSEADPGAHCRGWLDPGMAFGTGQHATTQLCLESIERICREPMPSSMLDMGSGSGLLAIAAAKLGVKQVLAIDHDPIAVEACKVNAGINGVVLRSVLDDTPPNARFSLIVANILAGPLIAMAPRLAACAGGPLVLSGLLAAQVNDVGRAYMRAGLTPVRTDVRDEWAALELKSGAP